ncbi:MAG: multidrug effflux MFS transporter [Rhodobacterales bacterium]|nr:multidrug effflux MFS transporter [Rhodobacterales bacterium]NCT11665.1 multidrug effflux MFS transporter [Rhodobacterales bacterium]
MTQPALTAPRRPALSQVEFVAMMAMLTATVAFSIDAMLPALDDIGAELTPANPNRAQLILSSFVLGMGLGTLFTGPLSDAWGRKPVILGGALLYCAGAALAYVAPSLEWVLAARLLQGLGAAGPRVVALATVRDLYAGRDMARIMSFVMIVFMVVPAVAPSIGALIIAGFGWRSVFAAFILFSLLSILWHGLRMPETLAPQDRRPLRAGLLWEALREVLRHPTVRLSIMVQTLSFSMLFAMLSTVQPLFDRSYGRGDEFPLWFAGIAVISALAGWVNSRLVVRIGMRRIIRGILQIQIVISSLMIAAVLGPIGQGPEFVVFLVWTSSVFFQGGLTIGNLNALAMEPMGHIAGMAASTIAALATVGSVIIAAPIGQMFDGTPLPVAIGILCCAILALILARGLKREKT